MMFSYYWYIWLYHDDIAEYLDKNGKTSVKEIQKKEGGKKNWARLSLWELGRPLAYTYVYI